MKLQNALQGFRDMREMRAVRPSTPLHPVYLVVRWLAPWAVVLAMATVIAHAADALLIGAHSNAVVASDLLNQCGYRRVSHLSRRVP